jgi:hypothetical protein
VRCGVSVLLPVSGILDRRAFAGGDGGVVTLIA